MTALKPLTIDRATWSAGRHNMTAGNVALRNALLTRSGQRCCLGFLGSACGGDDELLRDAALPSDYEDATATALAWPTALFEDHLLSLGFLVPWESIFAHLNDYTDIDDATREEWIATGFRLVLGYEVTYVGEYPPLPEGT